MPPRSWRAEMDPAPQLVGCHGGVRASPPDPPRRAGRSRRCRRDAGTVEPARDSHHRPYGDRDDSQPRWVADGVAGELRAHGGIEVGETAWADT